MLGVEQPLRHQGGRLHEIGVSEIRVLHEGTSSPGETISTGRVNGSLPQRPGDRRCAIHAEKVSHVQFGKGRIACDLARQDVPVGVDHLSGHQRREASHALNLERPDPSGASLPERAPARLRRQRANLTRETQRRMTARYATGTKSGAGSDPSHRSARWGSTGLYATPQRSVRSL